MGNSGSIGESGATGDAEELGAGSWPRTNYRSGEKDSYRKVYM